MDYRHNKKLVPYARQLRKNMTPQERRLWYEFLSGYPVRFQRQKIIGKYIVDFYCAKAALVVEIDGGQHFDSEGLAHDAERTAFLKKCGLQVIRIPNNEFGSHFYEVCEFIDNKVKEIIGEK